MASEDEEEYISYGTPLEREEDVASGKRKRQASDQGRLRVATFSQEVYDENGRRRFHGAFTGGFSAGYFNTVGSKEGWAPQSFTSSRKSRAELAQQRPYDYMDDEERAEQDSTRLSTTTDFDTFGFTVAEYARKEAAQDLKKRPSAIPEILPDEIIVPVSRSIGFELLRKMGWRHGRAIGPKHMAASSDAKREGRKAMLAFASCDLGGSSIDAEDTEVLSSESEAQILPNSTPIYVVNPKKDRYGFGFDPYKNAPEFRERWLKKETSDETKAATKHHSATFKPSLFRPNVGRVGSGFGIGALEELGEEDEDIYSAGVEMENVLSDDEACAPSLRSLPQPTKAETRPGLLPGFKPASQLGSKIELFPPPVIPPDFDGKHHFKDSLESEKVSLSYEPPVVAPPEDLNQRKLIEGLATFVARSGQKLESLYMEKRNNNSLFEFLSEGDGHDYYKRKLWEEQKKHSKEGVQVSKKDTALNSVQRGQILGEIPLHRPSMVPLEDRARLQSALASAFTKSSVQVEDSSSTSQLFISDPLKQARFEQYLKDKYQGGLKNVHAIAKSALTELERAQETLEFEAACQNLSNEGASQRTTSAHSGVYQKELQAIMNERFMPQSHSVDKVLATQSLKDAGQKYPVREEQQWRPLPLLCKRFNLPDPFSGKPPALPKPRSRTESFILLSNPIASVATNSIISEHQHLSDAGGSTHPPELGTRSPAIEGLDNGDQLRNIVEKPVDLYKAIFSDDSDEDNADSQEPTAVNNSAEAAQAALNRLEAGDFLASIGKELGLSVPPLDFNQARRANDSFDQLEATDVLARASAEFQVSRGAPQNVELASISSKQVVDSEVSEEAGRFLDYSICGLNVEHYDVFSKITSKKSNKKGILQDNRMFLSKSQPSSEESVSEDSSDDSKKSRRSRKKKKKERRNSKNEKQKGERDHKRRKKHGDNEHRSHKNHHRKRKKSSVSASDASK